MEPFLESLTTQTLRDIERREPRPKWKARSEMWSWLIKVDPNTVLAIVSVVGAWVYRRIAGDRAKTIEEIVNGAVRAILAEIAEHVPTSVPVETWLTGARTYVLSRIWTALAKVKIKKSPELERIVKAALEKATAEIAHRIAEERRVRAMNGGY